MLKDYYIPTVPAPGSDSRLSAFLSGLDDHFDDLALALDEPHPARCFFDANYNPENGGSCGKECLLCELGILLKGF